MIPVPSRRLLAALAAGTAASLAVLVFPGAWLLLVAFDLPVAGAALLDWLITPGPRALAAVRTTPDRIPVLAAAPVLVVVRNGASVPLRVRLRDTPPESFDAEV